MMAPANARVGERIDPALQLEVERFLYHEAELLDDRRFEEWLELLSDDVRYWAPTRTVRNSSELDRSVAGPEETALFDDDKSTLVLRVRRLRTGMAWAEEPPSLSRRLIGNIRIVASVSGSDQIVVKSNFILYRNRGATEEALWVGTRTDRLEQSDAGWRIRERIVVLDQSVILGKNITTFF